MINSKDLTRCMDNLAKLHANASSRNDRNLILEIGYIIKQELDLVKTWENSHSNSAEAMRQPIDTKKLLEDNTQLYKENEKLVKSIKTLEQIINSKIPSINNDLGQIKSKFDTLNNNLENGFS